jgi:hypothetical protein
MNYCEIAQPNRKRSRASLLMNNYGIFCYWGFEKKSNHTFLTPDWLKSNLKELLPECKILFRVRNV